MWLQGSSEITPIVVVIVVILVVVARAMIIRRKIALQKDFSHAQFFVKQHQFLAWRRSVRQHAVDVFDFFDFQKWSRCFFCFFLLGLGNLNV